MLGSIQKYRWGIITIFALFFIGISFSAEAQRFGGSDQAEGIDEVAFEAPYLQNLEYRNIGPFRGGRSVAVTGHPDQPNTYYTGFTGAGSTKPPMGESTG